MYCKFHSLERWSSYRGQVPILPPAIGEGQRDTAAAAPGNTPARPSLPERTTKVTDKSLYLLFPVKRLQFT